MVREFEDEAEEEPELDLLILRCDRSPLTEELLWREDEDEDEEGEDEPMCLLWCRLEVGRGVLSEVGVEE